METPQSSVLSPQSSALSRAVPDRAPAEIKPLLRRFWTEARKAGVAEAEIRGWIRQVTNGQTESTRALGRYELRLVHDLLRIHLRRRPFTYARQRPGRTQDSGLRTEGQTGRTGPQSSALSPQSSAADRVARRAAGLVELPTLAQLQLLWALAGELRLTDDELRGYALQALGLSPLRRAWRSDEVPALRLRTKDRREDFGPARRWPWHTLADAGKVINALMAIKLRRLRQAEGSGVRGFGRSGVPGTPEPPNTRTPEQRRMREPGEEG